MPAVATYSKEQMREIIVDQLGQIAPEADFDDLEDDEDVREALGLLGRSVGVNARSMPFWTLSR